MYNRYIPQGDGSYRKNAVAEPAPPPPPEPASFYEPPKKAEPEEKAGDFLRKLLPKNLNIGDLLVIALLLLMAADGKEEQNTALLTLALYLIL